MMVKFVPPVAETGVPKKAPVDWVKWLIWCGIGFAVAAGLFGLAFLIGYLTAFQHAAKIIHTDQALIRGLRLQLQTAQAQLARH